MYPVSPLEILPDGSAHDDADGENGVDAFFAGRCLDEIRASHHAYDRGSIVGVKDGVETCICPLIIIRSIPPKLENEEWQSGESSLNGKCSMRRSHTLSYHIR